MMRRTELRRFTPLRTYTALRPGGPLNLMSGHVLAFGRIIKKDDKW